MNAECIKTPQHPSAREVRNGGIWRGVSWHSQGLPMILCEAKAIDRLSKHHAAQNRSNEREKVDKIERP